MFTSNPFSLLSQSIPPIVMQAYVIALIILVAGGTLFDIVHKKSAKYFFDHGRNEKKKAMRRVGGAEKMSLAIQTAVVEGLTSGEFCNARRRIAHLLTMYGLVIFVVATLILVFGYPTPSTPAPAVIPVLWHVGALMVCVGGYWFWFFIRVDVASEGNPPYRLVHADLFIVSLLATATLALIWSYAQSAGSPIWASVFLALFVVATTVLFGSVPWSKFSHMFYKPAAAFQKRLEDASGSRRGLPIPADKPEVFGSGRRQPQNY